MIDDDSYTQRLWDFVPLIILGMVMIIDRIWLTMAMALGSLRGLKNSLGENGETIWEQLIMQTITLSAIVEAFGRDMFAHVETITLLTLLNISVQ